MTAVVKFDDLSTEDYCRIVAADDLDGWEAQQWAFANLRDVCGRLADRLDEMMGELRQSWAGAGAALFDMEAHRVVTGLRALADSAASNSDGMREMTVVLRDLGGAVRLLRAEDDDWQTNPDGDDAAIVAAARQSVRTELRDKLVEADQNLGRYAESFLVPAPEPVKAIPPETNVSATSFDEALRLQTSTTPPAASAAPPTVVTSGEPLVPDTGLPAPLTGAASGGGARLVGADARPSGRVLGEVGLHGLSRMRSTESRQEIVNRLAGRKCPRDVGPERTVRVSEGESVFDPRDAAVIPPVIVGHVPCGPHDSGPVLTEPVFRLYPEYWKQLEDERVPRQDAKPKPDEVGPSPEGEMSATAVEDTKPPVARVVRGGEYFRIVAGLPRDQAREFVAAQARLRHGKD